MYKQQVNVIQLVLEVAKFCLEMFALESSARNRVVSLWITAGVKDTCWLNTINPTSSLFFNH